MLSTNAISARYFREDGLDIKNKQEAMFRSKARFGIRVAGCSESTQLYIIPGRFSFEHFACNGLNIRYKVRWARH